MNWRVRLAIGIAAAAVALVGGPFVYIHLVQGHAPAPLTFGSASTTPSARATTPASRSAPASAATAGTWSIASGSLVGYRVNEVLLGQSHEAVGRTSSIAGAMTVSGTTVTAATFTVDMTTVRSDETRRDNQFNGRIMETGTYPTASFTLTQPIELGAIPSMGVQRTAKATGSLTLHGLTRTVTFTVTGRLTGSTVQIAGSIPITFADWNISNPSFGPVTTEDHGVLEFALNFMHE